MLSLYRTTPNNKKKQEISNRELDPMTSSGLKIPQLTTKESSPGTVKPSTSKKNKLKRGGNIEFNDKYLDEILHNKYLQMELAIQIFF